MRHITFFWALGILALSGCFDDAVTLGLGCENDLECGEGQACGPGVLEDNAAATPDQVCGIPQDKGWDACQSGDAATCRDFKTALTCRNGFWTETDCDVECEAQVGGQRNDGFCGTDVPETDPGCACAYAIEESLANASDCFQTDAGEDVVRSKAFVSDDVAVYLQTCDEWCEQQSGFSIYTDSVCAERFEDLLRGLLGPAVSTALSGRLGADETCVCRLTQEPSCSGTQPPTQCLDANAGTSAVALCGGEDPVLIQCSIGCGPIGVGMSEIDGCL